MWRAMSNFAPAEGRVDYLGPAQIPNGGLTTGRKSGDIPVYQFIYAKACAVRLTGWPDHSHKVARS